MAALISPTTSASTSADITLAAGSTMSFVLVGQLDNNDIVLINVKNSDSTYSILQCLASDGKTTLESTIHNGVRSRTIANSGDNAMTLQVVKPASTVASGIDNY